MTLRPRSASSLLLSVLLTATMAAQQPQAPSPWMDTSLSPDRRADLVLQQMTLDEKIQLVHGAGLPGFGPPPDASIIRSNGGGGFVPGIGRLGIPDLNMDDSAVGVAGGAAHSRYSTALPSALAEAATWDPAIGYAYGSLIGRELRDQGFNVSLGGGVNITREPRNGRNFEYLGEDPILAGKMVAQFIRGVQDQHIIGDIKHYAVNDQETGRNYGNAKLDVRAMRETDLLAFEIGVREGRPGMVMCSYNRINGDFACENSYTLNDVLKKTWGFQGWVISDWGGTHSTVKAALAGLDQEQPGSVYFGPELKKAVESGAVPAARLDDMVHRILRTMFASGIVDQPPVHKVVDVPGGFKVAQSIAEQGMVLLKNTAGLLPLRAATLKSLAVIGSHADVAVLSGGGSAQVDPPGGNAVPQPPRTRKPGESQMEAAIAAIFDTTVWFPSSPLDAIRAKAPAARVQFAQGDDVAEAAALAKSSEAAIVFVHQPSSEGSDRSFALAGDQDKLVEAVAAANPRTVVVLETGGAVEMPWVDRVGAAVEAWFPGIRGGEAMADILFGDVNPSGKLPLTFPKAVADLPHPRIAEPPVKFGFEEAFFKTLPPFDIDYDEGLKVGYKWYDAEGKQPLFPFGHGLSYTTFSYSALKAAPKQVTFTVKNTGPRTGSEIAEVYVSLPDAAKEPPKRLVAWRKIELKPGEAKSVTLDLDPQFLSIFNVAKNAWDLLPGQYKLMVGGSSRDLPLTATVME